MSPEMHRLVGLFSRMPEVQLHSRLLVERFGEELLAAAIDEGLFAEAGEADWYPCQGGGDRCPQTVFRNARPGSAQPHLGICPDCPTSFLASDDLRVMTFEPRALFAMFQRMLEIPEQGPTPDPVIERAWHLGIEARRGLGREVVAFMGYPSDHLALELAALHERHPRLLLVFLLTEGVSADLMQSHRAGREMEMVFVEHRLQFDQGRLWWQEPRPASTPMPASPTTVKEEAFCYAFDGAVHPLTEAGYREAVAKAEEQDLFVDVTAVNTTRTKAGRKGPDRAFEPVDLALSQGQLLAKLMLATPKPIRALTLRPGNEGGSMRYVDRVREKVDVSVGWRQWKFFQTAGANDSDRAFAFGPPKGSRFLLLYRPELMGPVPLRA